MITKNKNKNLKAKENIKSLISKIKQLNYEYYILDNPSISDHEYDSLMLNLQTLEKEYPEYQYKNSPTQNVGISTKSNSPFLSVKHDDPMFSIDNAFTFDDLEDFENKNLKIIQDNNIKNIEYICEIKIDGLSLNLHYNNGKLIEAVTRGDGKTGENITANILDNACIPKKVNFNEKIEIRGEIILTKNDFLNYKKDISNLNDEIEQWNLKNRKNIALKQIPVNSRNASAGLIRNYNLATNLLSTNNFIKKYSEIKLNYIKKLKFFSYNIPNWNLLNLKNQIDVLNFLKNNNFLVFDKYFLCDSMEKVKTTLKSLEHKINDIEIDADGIVIKINDFFLQDKLGYTAKSPRWAVAYKFKSKASKTNIVDIFVTIGRTGKVTYNAKLKPVFVDGSTISYATLHNFQYIENLDIRIGDNVEVIKAGGVIPRVVKVVDADSNKRQAKFIKITNCPSCGGNLFNNGVDADDYCINLDCPSIIKYSLLHFCSRNAMNIDNLGEKIIEKCLKSNVLTKIEDLYTLTKSDEEGKKLQQKFLKAISGNENLKTEDSIILQKIILNIKKSKNNSLERLLIGLNIKHLGQKIAYILAFKYENIDDLMSASLEELSSLEEIGPVIAKSCFCFFQSDSNKKLIMFLKENQVNMSFLGKEITKNKNNLFYNKKFLITGEFDEPRSSLLKKIEYLGGISSSSVSANLNFLLVGDNPGSKLDKALAISKKNPSLQIIYKDELNQILINI